MMYIDHIEDDPIGNPEMCVAYIGYGTDNQYACRMERAMILVVDDCPHAFVDADTP